MHTFICWSFQQLNELHCKTCGLAAFIGASNFKPATKHKISFFRKKAKPTVFIFIFVFLSLLFFFSENTFVGVLLLFYATKCDIGRKRYAKRD